MAEIEQLSILIDVVNSYEEELNSLLFKLGEVKQAVETVDGSNIDFDTLQAQQQLTALQSQMAALRGQMAMMDDDIDIGVSGAGGGGMTAGQMGAMSQEAREVGDRLSQLDLRMTDLHNALARVVPMLLVFIGALPAVIGALVGLAAAAVAATAALGALGVFGAMGAALVRGDGDMTAGFEDILTEVQNSFMDAFEPLMRRLAPLVEDAIGGLGRLFQAVANEGDALIAFADDARDFGEWVMQTLPSFLRDLGTFADVSAESLGALVQLLGDVSWFEALSNMLADVLPEFTTFVALLMDMVPVIIQISVGFLRAANGLLVLFKGLSQVLKLLPISNQLFGALVGGMIAAYGVALVLNSAIFRLAATGLVALGKTLVSAAGALLGFSTSSWSATAAAFSLASAISALKFAIVGLLAATGIGLLLPVIGGIASTFLGASSSIDQATSSLREFRKEQNKLTGGNNPYRHPDVRRGETTGTSRFAGSSVDITVENTDADTETIRNQTHNGMYRLERTRRGR